MYLYFEQFEIEIHISGKFFYLTMKLLFCFYSEFEVVGKHGNSHDKHAIGSECC